VALLKAKTGVFALCQFLNKKILKVDYLLGSATEIVNFISAKKPKIEFSLFHPTVSHSTDISPKILGENIWNPEAKPSGNFLIKSGLLHLIIYIEVNVIQISNL